MTIPALGSDLKFVRSYSSMLSDPQYERGIFGAGWTHNGEEKLFFDVIGLGIENTANYLESEVITLRTGSGNQLRFYSTEIGIVGAYEYYSAGRGIYST